MPPFDKQKQTRKADRQRRYRDANRCIASILARLYAGERLSIKALAQECEVSLRTMQRYVNERLTGFPIAKESDSFFLDDVRQHTDALSDEERAVLRVLDEFSRTQGSGFYAKAHRLFQRLRIRNDAYFVHIPTEDISPLLPTAATLERAIEARRKIACRYKMNGEIYDIELKPLKIAHFGGYWYLVAMDARNDEVKKYLLRHIRDIKTSDTVFEPPRHLEEALSRAMSVWFDPHGEPFEVRLFVDRYAATYVRRQPLGPTQRIVGEDSDGSMEIALDITHDMEIVPLIKQWIPHIVVLEPDRLAETVKEDIDAYAAMLEI